jgi:hypothetical protein
MNVVGFIFCTVFAIGASVQWAQKAKTNVICTWEVDKYEKTGDIKDVSPECQNWFNYHEFCASSRFPQPLGGGYVDCRAVREAWREADLLNKQLGYGWAESD